MGTPDLGVTTLGACRIDSPLVRLLRQQGTTQHYVDESDRVLLDDTVAMVSARGLALADLPGFEPGGPRRKIFFDPSKTRVGIVTCGGLCPGLNDVIRALVVELTSHYSVHRIAGFRNGCRALTPACSVGSGAPTARPKAATVWSWTSTGTPWPLRDNPPS
jgi:6-phosphofructokinase 1